MIYLFLIDWTVAVVEACILCLIQPLEEDGSSSGSIWNQQTNRYRCIIRQITGHTEDLWHNLTFTIIHVQRRHTSCVSGCTADCTILLAAQTVFRSYLSWIMTYRTHNHQVRTLPFLYSSTIALLSQIFLWDASNVIGSKVLK